MSQAVAVFGGSFDPVHDAHLAVARRVLEQVSCDEVWFLPAARAVHKPAGARADAAHRKAMLELVVSGIPHARICTLELDRGVAMRSVESLRELSATWPTYRWYFILGEDSFRDLEAWYQPEELLRIAAPVIAPRPGASGSRPATWRGIELRWLEGEEIDLDSTALRAALARGENPAGIDPRVLEYIRENGLYLEQ